MFELAVEKNARALGARLSMPYATLPISKLSQGEGALPTRYELQDTCFWRLCSMQENVVSPSASLTGMQRIKMQCAPLQVNSCLTVLSFPHIIIKPTFILTYLCRDLNEHMRRLQQQSDSRRRAAVNEMMRQRATEVGGSS